MIKTAYEILKEVFIEGNSKSRTREQAEFDWEGELPPKNKFIEQ